MPSTPSTLLRLELQAVGENDGTWGIFLNNKAIKLLEEAIAGYVEVPVLLAGATLTTSNYTSDQQRAMFINLTGTDVAGNIIVPPVSKFWIVKGSFTSGSVVFKTAGGTGVTINAGDVLLLVCDGTNVYQSGLTISQTFANNLSEVPNKATARTNLGLGALAVLNAPADNSITSGMLQTNSVLVDKLASYVPNSTIRWNASSQPEIVQDQPGFIGMEVFSTPGTFNVTTPDDGFTRQYKVTVTGGGGGNNGTAGGNSSFSCSGAVGGAVSATANGGLPGDPSDSGGSAAGGHGSLTGTTGLVIRGGNGGSSFDSLANTISSVGGASLWGGGGGRSQATPGAWGSGSGGRTQANPPGGAGGSCIFYVKVPPNTACQIVVGAAGGGTANNGVVVIEKT